MSDRSRTQRTLCLAIVFSLLMGGLAGLGSIQAATSGSLTVCGSGCDHVTIQGAVDAASAGSVIRVGPGTYAEDLVVPSDKEGLALTADGAAEILLSSGGVLRVDAANVRILGFQITHPEGGVAVAALADRLVLRENLIDGAIQAAAGLDVDARLNDWATEVVSEVVDRVDAVGADVLVSPIRLPDGSQVPPAPSVAPSGHCSAAGFAPRFIEEAIWCAHSGGTIALHPSDPVSGAAYAPTPDGFFGNPAGNLLWKNRDITGVDAIGEPIWVAGFASELLDGLTLCGGPETPSGTQPPAPTPGGTCVNDPTGIVVDAHAGGIGTGSPSSLEVRATGVTVSGLTVKNTGEGDGIRGITVRGDSATLRGNVITGNFIFPDHAEGPTVNQVGIWVAGTAAGLEATANEVEHWDNLGIYLASAIGDGNAVRDNLVRHNRWHGLLIEGPTGSSLHVTGNTFAEQYSGLRIGVADTSGFQIRENVFDTLNMVAASVQVGITDTTIDLRLNDWKIYDHERLPLRVDDESGTNEILQVPFIGASGGPEPGLPTVSDGSHSTTPATCDAHPDAEFIAGMCRFFTIEAAIDFAHPGETVYIPMSNDLVEPTPYFEALSIRYNNIGERLVNLKLCSSLGGAICASAIEPGHWQTQFEERDSTSWGTPPVALSGEAIRIDVSAAPNHGSTSWFPGDDPAIQVEDLDRIAWDQYLESGACAAGSPRIQVGVDTTGDGARDATIHVTSASLVAACALGEWQHIEFMDLTDLSWNSASVGGPSTGNQNDAQTAAETAANANGVSHRVTAVNLVFDAPSGIIWYDNHIVNNGFLGEPMDETCVFTRDSAGCRDQLAVSHTIIDGTGSGAAAVVHLRDRGMTLDGLTIRHTGEPTNDVAGVRLSAVYLKLFGNRIHMEGGGCSPDDFVGGTCFDPYRVVGIAAQNGRLATIRDNLIAADLFAEHDAAIGGTDGIRGNLLQAVVSDNVLRAWGSNGMVLTGDDVVVDGNVIQGAGTGLLLAGASGATVQKNEFTVSTEAMAISSGTLVNTVANDNSMGLSNAMGLVVRDSAGSFVADFTCNDWGVYNGAAIQGHRIRADNAPNVNAIQTDPFTAPDASSGTQCLVAPSASFSMSASSVFAGDAVSFTDTSSPGQKPILIRQWDFGDGASSTDTDPVHSYALPGTYTVTLRIEDADGMVSTAQQTLVVASHAPTMPAFGDHQVLVGNGFAKTLTPSGDPGADPFTFSASGLPGGAVLSNHWDGRGTIAWTPVPSEVGTYTVTLTLTDRWGASSSQTFHLEAVDAGTAPRFTQLSDVLAPVEQSQVSEVRALDPNGGPVALGASGLPGWATFVDLGSGHGRFYWTPPAAAAGDVHSISVTATAGSESATASFQVTAFGVIRLDLSAPESFIESYPGEQLHLDVDVRNWGNTDAMVTLQPSDGLGWWGAMPAPFSVPAGDTVTVSVPIVPDGLGYNGVGLTATAAGSSATATNHWWISVPLVSEVTFTGTSAAMGPSGSVMVEHLDASPGRGVKVTFAERHASGPQMFWTEQSGTTDANGLFEFGFTGPTSRLPGEHEYRLVVEKDGERFISNGTFFVI